jgi:2-oxoglutarate ferredoxin oxidoreductase subunit gamma
MRKEILFAGFGGQGIVIAGYLLGMAASIFDNKYAVQTQTYGPEARGGATASEVIISDEVIDYPKILKPDILIAMSNEAYFKFYLNIKPNGIILVDPEMVDLAIGEEPHAKIYKVYATKCATELGKKIVTNIVFLGVLVSVTKVVTESAIKGALIRAIPKFKELNLRALEEGIKIGRELV